MSSFTPKREVIKLIAQKQYYSIQKLWNDIEISSNKIEINGGWYLTWNERRRGIYAMHHNRKESHSVCFYPYCQYDYSAGHYCAHRNPEMNFGPSRKRKLADSHERTEIAPKKMYPESFTPVAQSYNSFQIPSTSRDSTPFSNPTPNQKQYVTNIIQFAFHQFGIPYLWIGDLNAHLKLLKVLEKQLTVNVNVNDRIVTIRTSAGSKSIRIIDPIKNNEMIICAHLGCHNEGCMPHQLDWFCNQHFCSGRQLGGKKLSRLLLKDTFTQLEHYFDGKLSSVETWTKVMNFLQRDEAQSYGQQFGGITLQLHMSEFGQLRYRTISGQKSQRKWNPLCNQPICYNSPSCSSARLINPKDSHNGFDFRCNDHRDIFVYVPRFWQQ